MVGTAITYRMQGGFPGDVNRTHPANIVPVLNDTTSPVLLAGQVAVFNGANQDVRAVAAGDAKTPGTTATRIAGITVRSFPTQAVNPGANYDAQALGIAALPSGTVIDTLRTGFIMGVVNGTPNLGDPVYVWAAASTGNHVQGQFEAAAVDGSTFALPLGSYFNGPPDALGNVEIFIPGIN